MQAASSPIKWTWGLRMVVWIGLLFLARTGKRISWGRGRRRRSRLAKEGQEDINEEVKEVNEEQDEEVTVNDCEVERPNPDVY